MKKEKNLSLNYLKQLEDQMEGLNHTIARLQHDNRQLHQQSDFSQIRALEEEFRSIEARLRNEN